MTNATFLALQGPDGTTADLAPIVDAARGQNGRLSVLHVGAVPLLSYSITASPYAMPVVPEGWLGERNKMAAHLAEKQAQTRAFLGKEGLTGEVATLCAEPSAMHDLVAIRALFADVSVLLDSLRDSDTAFNNIVYGLLFEAPGPVVLNVEQNGKALAPENVLIAWNSGVPAARAVRAALPLLKTAKEVTIASFDADPSRWGDGDNPGADLATWLAHHGCNVVVQEYVTGRKSVSDAIVGRARERTADLVVMGAYGRSRWNERFFGGTTESMIKQQDMPVLLAH
ncbi:universal stress protein family protein [Yoonia maricola]|uniref:Universal stress protein family protein n=1 Tax=Yoonia maricola TaxID=420999 RepID=A0A2M8W059_9RHOB|nr:universal stress protein [Yoonia maricola]PJI84310.1 universal stress protein family protein [Yoonia maricola]